MTRPFLVVIFLMLSTLICYGQFTVDITIVKAYVYGYQGDGYGPRIRLYKDDILDDAQHALWLQDNCAKLTNLTSGWVTVNRTYVTNIPANDPTFNLFVRTHEERKQGSPDCTVEGVNEVTTRVPDAHETTTMQTINLNDIPPGSPSQFFVFSNTVDNTLVEVYIQVSYTPVKQSITTPAGGNVYCSDNEFKIFSRAMVDSARNTSGLRYEWEYNIKGDTINEPGYFTCRDHCVDQNSQCWQHTPGDQCTTDFDNCVNSCFAQYPDFVLKWNSLPVQSTDSFPLHVFKDVFRGNLSGIKAVKFRVRAIGTTIKGPYSDETGYFTFAPPAPSSSAMPFTTKSCTVEPTGQISLANITSVVNSYRYILYAGDYPADTQCDPNGGGVGTYASAIDSTSSLLIRGIPGGQYSLFIVNPGGGAGSCSRKIGSIILVDTIQRLSISTMNIVPITCQDSLEGKISIKTTAGDTTSIRYALMAGANTIRNRTLPQRVMAFFDSLAAGIYGVYVDDQCTQPILKTISLTEEARVDTTAIAVIDATCFSPANGQVSLTVSRSSGALIRQLSPDYHFELYRSTNLVTYIEQPTNNVTFQALPSGRYSLVAMEKGGAACNSSFVSFSIAPPDSIRIDALDSVNVKCFGGHDGRITVHGAGGSGNYRYELSGPRTESNQIGVFDSLMVGQYLITLKNNFACTDNSYVKLVLTQPTELVPTLSKQDISCFGLSDGEIMASVTGGTVGTEGYGFSWATRIGNIWMTLGETSNTRSALADGLYRATVEDSNGCQVTTPEVAIIEPALLVIDSVELRDIACVNDRGHLIVHLSGGTPPYDVYSNDSRSTRMLTDSTALDAGNYQVIVVDSRGCEQRNSQTYAVTAPPTELNFTVTVSDYNGYNISCFSGHNGWIVVNPQGGNGDSYAGYRYSLDDTVRTTSMFDSLASGDHRVDVIDGRGCKVSKTITLKESNAKLNANAVGIDEVHCFGDSDGEISIIGEGGVPPYRYALLPASDQQVTGTYSQLGVGIYEFVVYDQNDCTQRTFVELKSQVPKMVPEVTVSDVSCYGGANGSIRAAITGGEAPLSFNWSNGATSSMLTNLPFGPYLLTVTDNAGCSITSTFSVFQPASPLQTTATTTAACFGQTNGTILANSTGGTAPYLYSIDNGTPVLASVLSGGVGLHQLITYDSNGCMVQEVVSIVAQTAKPDANFLAATLREARDTLVITDISFPKPDSILWNFQPMPKIIDDSPNAPVVLYPNPGTFTIMMNGYFGGCVYTATKMVTISPLDTVRSEVNAKESIIQLSASPNPTTGVFTVDAKLDKKRTASILVYDMLGAVALQQRWDDVEQLHEQITLSVANGVYLLRFITDNDARDLRIVVKR